MQITIINGFYIETDNRNFTLKQKYIGTRKDGTKKEAVKMISHCGSLEQALETFLRMNQIPHDSKLAVDLMEYANYIEQSNKEAVQALKSVLEGNHDDVCEWESDYGFVSDKYKRETGCGYTFYDLHHAVPFEYCPYCGKKIKVVGD